MLGGMPMKKHLKILTAFLSVIVMFVLLLPTVTANAEPTETPGTIEDLGAFGAFFFNDRLSVCFENLQEVLSADISVWDECGQKMNVNVESKWGFDIWPLSDGLCFIRIKDMKCCLFDGSEIVIPSHVMALELNQSSEDASLLDTPFLAASSSMSKFIITAPDYSTMSAAPDFAYEMIDADSNKVDVKPVFSGNVLSFDMAGDGSGLKYGKYSLSIQNIACNDGDTDTICWERNFTFYYNKNGQVSLGYEIPFGKGAGTEKNPYQIGTVEEYNALQNFTEKASGCKGMYFILTADLSVTQGICQDTFYGTFDGRGHVLTIDLVKNLKYDNAGLTDINAGVFKNIIFEGSVVGAGGTNRHADVVVRSNAAAGVIMNCINRASTTAGESGGFAAFNSGKIINCLNYGSQTGTANYASFSTNTGGITGQLSSGTVSNCVSCGTQSGSEKYTAGIAANVNSGSTLENNFSLIDPIGNGVAELDDSMAKKVAQDEVPSLKDGLNSFVDKSGDPNLMYWTTDAEGKLTFAYVFVDAPEVKKSVNVIKGVQLTWNAVDGADGYEICQMGESTEPQLLDTVEGTSYVVPFNETVTGTFVVRAVSGKTKSQFSEPVTYSFVSTPELSKRTNTSEGIRLSWNEIEGAGGYALYRWDEDTNGAWARIATITDPETVSWLDTGVASKNGTVYHYTVRAIAKDGKTLSGCYSKGRTMVRLFTPTVSSAFTEDETAVTATWDYNDMATGYEYRILCGSEVILTKYYGSKNALSRTIRDLEAGKDYSVAVRSVFKTESAGSYYSAWSEAVNAVSGSSGPSVVVEG